MKALSTVALFSLASLTMAAPVAAQSHHYWPSQPEPQAYIQPNSSLQGSLDSRDEYDGSRYLDRLSFSVQRGQTVTVDVQSHDFDTLVRVEQGGWQVAENDDRRSGDTDSFLSFVATQSGTLDLIVTSWGSRSTGYYTARVMVEDAWVPPPPTISQGGGTILGELGYRDERDWSGTYRDRHFVELQYGDVVDISVESRDFDTVLEVTLDGRSIARNDDIASGIRDSAVRFDAPYSGVYEVIVTSFSAGQTGRYSIQINNLPPPPRYIQTAPPLPPPIAAPRPIHDPRRPPPIDPRPSPPPHGGYLPDHQPHPHGPPHHRR